jgi:ComF family protein
LFLLPKTDFHLEKDNPVSILFWGRVNISYAASYYTFHKGSQFQKLIHKLKYHNKKEIGIVLGRHFGESLKKSAFFKDVDLIIPVPLHPKKEKIRGYNQAHMIAIGLGQSMQKPIETENLIRLVHTESQTRKSKLERWKNVDRIFDIRSTDSLCNKHILLVDDVVTTGATLESCAHAILKAEGAKVSIATLAYA